MFLNSNSSRMAQFRPKFFENSQKTHRLHNVANCSEFFILLLSSPQKRFTKYANPVKSSNKFSLFSTRRRFSKSTTAGVSKKKPLFLRGIKRRTYLRSTLERCEQDLHKCKKCRLEKSIFCYDNWRSHTQFEEGKIYEENVFSRKKLVCLSKALESVITLYFEGSECAN